MFGNNHDRTDYYAGDDGRVYRSEDFRHGFSPVWLLPILLIPLALLVWGGSELLRNSHTQGLTMNNSGSSTKQASTNNSGGQTRVSAVNLVKAPTVTPTPTPKISPVVTHKNKTAPQVGVGGGPEVSPTKSAVPQTPHTGYGW